ncbi:hypothetical protein BT96DRAFT_931250 [Gymnopus androsaceus JB14]|uniref:Uncharacterized protein n=1 Tax=Gymnopus androsaceus JB14 TaxID=1447944 RepID=A0A6A4IIZ4_9AGAR|nr:hypothetical protein BT96DRAFT_931250 [Gymnopus androsaceus JB14]
MFEGAQSAACLYEPNCTGTNIQSKVSSFAPIGLLATTLRATSDEKMSSGHIPFHGPKYLINRGIPKVKNKTLRIPTHQGSSPTETRKTETAVGNVVNEGSEAEARGQDRHRPDEAADEMKEKATGAAIEPLPADFTTILTNKSDMPHQRAKVAHQVSIVKDEFEERETFLSERGGNADVSVESSLNAKKKIKRQYSFDSPKPIAPKNKPSGPNNKMGLLPKRSEAFPT